MDVWCMKCMDGLNQKANNISNHYLTTTREEKPELNSIIRYVYFIYFTNESIQRDPLIWGFEQNTQLAGHIYSNISVFISIIIIHE